MHFPSPDGLGVSACLFYSPTVIYVGEDLGDKLNVCLNLAPVMWVMREYENLPFEKELKDPGMIQLEKRSERL